MKIVFFADDFPPNSIGGAGIIAFEQAKELLVRGHEVHVITTMDDVSREGVRFHEGLTIHSIYSKYSERFRSYKSLYNPRVIAEVKRILKTVKPDIVHAHNIHQKFSYATLRVAKKYAKKVFLTAHDVMSFHYTKLYPRIHQEPGGSQRVDYRVSWLEQAYYFRFHWNPVRNIVIKYYLQNVDVVFAVSNALAEALRQNGIKNTVVLHNGIDVKNFEVQENTTLEFKEKNKLNNKKILFFAGRLSKAKGGDVILRALDNISKKIPNICFLFAGKRDSYVEEFLRRAEEIGVGHSVVFLGWINRNEIKNAYSACDAVPVLSVYLDPFPTTNLEAMASKKPVVGTCFGGTPEVVVDGKTGYIVNPNNQTEVAEKIIKLFSDDKLARSLGHAGYSIVSSQFTIQNQVDILCKYYVNSVNIGEDNLLDT